MYQVEAQEGGVTVRYAFRHLGQWGLAGALMLFMGTLVGSVTGYALLCCLWPPTPALSEVAQLAGFFVGSAALAYLGAATSFGRRTLHFSPQGLKVRWQGLPLFRSRDYPEVRGVVVEEERVEDSEDTSYVLVYTVLARLPHTEVRVIGPLESREEAEALKARLSEALSAVI